jgi:hypothetical protein
MADLSTSAPKRGTTPTKQLAELHRLCREDYASSADRRVQDHRDDAHLIASASEAVAAR